MFTYKTTCIALNRNENMLHISPDLSYDLQHSITLHDLSGSCGGRSTGLGFSGTNCRKRERYRNEGEYDGRTSGLGAVK